MQLFVNDLTVMDFSYLCEKRGIVGESWIVDIVLDGSLNDQSMVLDFGRVKKQIKRIVDDALDHKLLVPNTSSNVTVTADPNSEHYWVDFERAEGSIHLYCPPDAFAFVDDVSITKETAIDYLRAVIKKELPNNVNAISLKLREEDIPGVFYHYTHGLKKHDGNCQRIAHGHRSTIQIFVDDMRMPSLEHYWCKRWQDIYVGSQEDVVQPSAMSLSEKGKALLSNDHVCYSYLAEQGRFELIVPGHCNEVIPTDSTVECIAEYIANEIKQQEPDSKIAVVAFEGVGKGAIGYA